MIRSFKMSELPLFPTLDRPKHSKLMAYPIGAEALSRALDGVPQHRMIACDFFAGNPHHEQNKRASIYFMAVSYERVARSFHHSQSSAERGVFDPRWRIHIYAVPVETRAAIKRLLMEDVLQSVVRPWLMENASNTGKTGGAALILHYDRENDVITSEARGGFSPERST
jgi:hypothetical protein